MRDPEDDQRDATPEVCADGEGPPEGPFMTATLASRAARLAAAAIDLAVTMSVMWVVSRVTAWDPFSEDSNGWDIHLGNAVGNFLCYFLPNAYLLMTRAQTIGKAAVGIRVISDTGQAPNFMQLVCVREGIPALLGAAQLAGEFFWLIDSLFIFRRLRRCLHDELAGTIVVRI